MGLLISIAGHLVLAAVAIFFLEAASANAARKQKYLLLHLREGEVLGGIDLVTKDPPSPDEILPETFPPTEPVPIPEESLPEEVPDDVFKIKQAEEKKKLEKLEAKKLEEKKKT